MFYFEFAICFIILPILSVYVILSTLIRKDRQSHSQILTVIDGNLTVNDFKLLR
jgi:hypothetical protein